MKANELAIEVGRIEGSGGQMCTRSDGARRRTPGGRGLHSSTFSAQRKRFLVG